MSQIRGSRLGGYSYEDDTKVEPIAIRQVTYACQGAHVTEVPFAHDADEIPLAWDCPRCGRVAAMEGIDFAVAEAALSRDTKVKGQGKTPWQMLLERRSLDELEELLEERLELLRGPVRASA